ncbi:MAG: hypothetical protein E6R03_15405 [Hyphomicrobiaceae bacterium]|nr:MAG: hypothetical protein E6R03_15405 [Hyphomicrobiaceae bacterium]
MPTIMTADEYKELNELRRYKAAREAQDEKIREGTKAITEATEAIRKIIAERKQSRLPDGGTK